MDVSQVECLSSVDQILKQIRGSRRHLELLFLLDLMQNSVLLCPYILASTLLRCSPLVATLQAHTLRFDFLDERSADVAGRFFGDKEEHVCRLVHVLNLAHIYRLLQISQGQCLLQNELLLVFVKLGLLNSAESVYFRKVIDLAFFTLLWVSSFPFFLTGRAATIFFSQFWRTGATNRLA